MALKDINLIPEDILARKKLLRSLRLWSAVLCGLLLIVSGWCGLKIQSALRIKPDQDLVLQTRQELRSTVSRIRDRQKKYDRLLHKRDGLLTPFSGSTVSLPLRTMATSLNSRTWLQQVEILPAENPASGGRNMQIRGASLSHADITGFLQALQSQALFQDVTLTYARLQESGSGKRQWSGPVIEFQIKGRFGPGGESP